MQRAFKITFSKNDGSGIVKITANNRKISQNDLYSPTFEDFTVSKSLRSVSIFSHAGLFLCIFAVLLGLNVFLFTYLIPSIQSYPELYKNLPECGTSISDFPDCQLSLSGNICRDWNWIFPLSVSAKYSCGFPDLQALPI